MRPARKFSTDEDVLSRQHGGRKATVAMEIQRQKQIFAADAGNAIDVAVVCQVERADALVGVEPHRRSAQARQAIDLLIRAQFHIVEAPIVCVVTKETASAKPSRAEEPLAGQRSSDEVALAAEPGLARPAGDTGNLNIPLENDEPRPAIGPSFRHLVGIRRKRRQRALWGGRSNTRRLRRKPRRLALAADLIRCRRPQVRAVPLEAAGAGNGWGYGRESVAVD